MIREADAMPRRRKALLVLVFVSFVLLGCWPGRAEAAPTASSSAVSPQAEAFADLDLRVETALQEGRIPGAVILIGSAEEILYHRAFGFRSLEPEKVRMSEDTIFDLASLTKVIATTTAVMQLVEKGKLALDAPVTRYWPAFGKNGKKKITIRQLLTHYSGLRADLSLKPSWSGYAGAMRRIVAEKPLHPPGTSFLYSDINFEVLGELVCLVSGLPLDTYCARAIFGPLGMKETGFGVPPGCDDRVAPTEYRQERLMRGEVHDPACYRMGGVAGHAGLFSSAADLSIFARMLLGKGEYAGVRILSARTVERMTIPQAPAAGKAHGLGWELRAPFASNRDDLPGVGAYGHLGYTGTSLWIDPVTDTYVIVLTNRVHPDGKGKIKTLRSEITDVVSAARGPLEEKEILTARPELSPSWGKIRRRVATPRPEPVAVGIDVLKERGFSLFKGKRLGLITNHTGRDAAGTRTLDLLKGAPGVRLVAVFSPEHGLSGNAEGAIASRRDAATGLPVYSLYGERRRPTPKMFAALDAVVFDIQDVGVRFYTYITTMGYAMEAAAKARIPFYVLDRPNPLTAARVQGPVMDPELKSFTGYFPLPVRHGMTVGELAELFNAEYHIGAELRVVKMKGYRRDAWFDETGLAWVNPSPNLRSLAEAILYPGVALVEGANVSVGRGTDTPFELVGAPWIRGEELADYLNQRTIPGIGFLAAEFTPAGSFYQGRTCRGVRIVLKDRSVLDAPRLGIEIAAALYRLFPGDFKIEATRDLIGSQQIFLALKAGEDPQAIALRWEEPLARFLDLREKYLLYRH